jgi:hypothetical protein
MTRTVRIKVFVIRKSAENHIKFSSVERGCKKIIVRVIWGYICLAHRLRCSTRHCSSTFLFVLCMQAPLRGVSFVRVRAKDQMRPRKQHSFFCK